MDRVKIYLLHGFLGRPEDWNFLTSQLSPKCEALDYFASTSLGPANSFQEFGRNLNDHVRAQGTEHNILIGYSLGGRLALHALENDPALWSKVILLSTNPGLQTDIDRTQRGISDEQWAARFAKESWNDLIEAWNSQGVLRDSKEPMRLEQDYRREFLSESLQRWSLARQQDLRPLIVKNLNKLNWIVGEQDTKFLAIANELKKQNPALDLSVIPQASHRVFFDQPELVAAKIKKAANL